MKPVTLTSAFLHFITRDSPSLNYINASFKIQLQVPICQKNVETLSVGKELRESCRGIGLIDGPIAAS